MLLTPLKLSDHTISIPLKSLPTSTSFRTMMYPFTAGAIEQIPTPAIGEFEKRRHGVAASADVYHESITRVFSTGAELE